VSFRSLAEVKARIALAFEKPLQELGWSLSRDIEIHYRWGAGDTELTRPYAKELIQPDLILANTNTAMAALHHEASTVPIVFPQPCLQGAFLVSRIPKRRSLHARAAARGRYRAGSGPFQ
jgi:hypothetical protein